MKTNQEHLAKLTNVEKAEFTLGHLTSNGGYLTPGQAQKFIRLMIKKSVLMKMFTVFGMKEYKYRLNTIRFGSRVLKPGTPGQALPSDDRVRPDIAQQELDVKLFKCEVLVDDEVFEDNVEGAGLRNTIMQMLGEAISRDTEYVVINGDTASSDALLKQLDGLLKQITSHSVDAGGTRLSRSHLKGAVKAIPHEYKYDNAKMRFLTSTNAVLDYTEELGDRATEGGDKNVIDYVEPKYKRIPLVPVPEFPENLTPGNETECVLMDPANFNVGFHRKIQIRVHEDYQSGSVIIVGRVRFDAKLANEDATSKIQNVLAS
jgi:HK97 family phage major capsid protein